ncbi:hypothetical protein HRI_000970600 [Hibiscus trionum]|uniref:FLZ-type domain-containing protein n=1 Tax=Hibiscus trionum TaxID=183268 RepID=A0A9W7H9T1_HIBTR|nr:hypothetical protein HRI_000970600 [Hibiscus trionum]
MTPKLRSPFEQHEKDGEGEDGKKKNLVYSNFCKGSSVVVGLRILTQIPQGKKSVVVKPVLKITFPVASSKHRSNSNVRLPPAYQDSCFLKSCYLCNKNLCLDKAIFMYRGDQGFCSIECRGRQIVLDEMKELELSSKRTIPSYRHCNTISGRRETRLLMEDLHRRNKSTSQNQNHWAIVS